MAYKPKWLKTDINNNDQYNWNKEGWESGNNRVELTHPPLSLPTNNRKQLNNRSVTENIDLTSITIPQPQKEGFWDKARNARLQDIPVLKYIAKPFDEAYKIPLTQRFFTTLGNTIGGEGNVKADDGSAMQKMDAGKVGNLVADIAGTGVAYGMKLPGMNNSAQGAINNALNPVEAKAISLITKKPVEQVLTEKALNINPFNITNKVAQKATGYGLNAVKSGLDMGIGNAVQGVAQGQDIKDIGKNAFNGLWQGATFGTAVKGIGEGVGSALSRKANIELPKADTSEVKTSNLVDNPLIQPSKMQGNTNIPNANTKPVESLKEPLSTKDLEFTTKGIKYAKQYEKITDAEYLKKHIADLETAMATVDESTKLEMNLQLFAAKERLKKLSKVYSNTLQKTDVLTQAEKELLNPKDFQYNVKAEEESLAEARRRINTNLDGEIKKLNNKELYSGADLDTMMGILEKKYLTEARQTGDYTEVSKWLKNVRKAGTEGGRTVQAFAKYSRTKEGKLIEAQRTVDNVEDGLKKTNPKLIDDINKETKDLKDSLDGVKKQAAKELEEKLPEQMLADKVSSTVKESKDRKPSLIQDMVNELFRVAKESPLPEKVAKAKRSPLEYLKESLDNKGQYADVWEKAKNIVKEKYKDDPEASRILEDYFNKGIMPNYSNATVGNSVKISIKDLGTTLDNIARSAKGDKEKFLSDLTDHITKTTGASSEDASLLASKIKEQYDSLVKEKSQSILKQMFKEVSPKKQKDIFQKVTELINLGAYDDNAIKDLIKEKKGLPILDGNDIKFITEHMDRASKFPEGSYENRMELSKVGGLIKEKEHTTGMEKFQAAQRIGMLLNPKSTVVRNPTGNALLKSLEAVKKNIAGVPLDATTTYLRNKVRAKKGLPLVERTQLFNPLKDTIESGKGFITGVKEWGKDIINGVDTSPVGGGVELPSKVKIFDENASNPVQRTINKAANKIHFVVGKALKLGDTPFYNSAYAERIAELKKIYKTNEITQAMKDDAVAYGLEMTLQNDSALAELFTGLKQGHFIKDEHQGAKIVYKTFANLILPFAKTPANVLDKFLDYSPVGVLKATGHALYTSGKGTFNQKKFVDTMARGLTGTGLAALGYLMAKKGLITGGRNSNNKVEGLENSLGKQNYAYKVGDTYQTVDWALPAAAPIMMGADIYNSIKNSNGKMAALQSGASSAVNLLFNSTLLQGPSKLTGGYNPAASIGNALLNTTTQATPSFGKQISQLVDPYVRETYDPNPLKQTLNKTIARIPFASKSLPVKQDSLGNDIKAFQGKNNVWNVMFNPGFTTKYNPTDVQKEIIRLYEDSGETKQLPPAADKIIPATKEKVYKTKPNVPGTPQVVLSGKEYTEYQKLIGIYSLEAYNKVINDSQYADKTDEEKASAIGSELEKAKAKAKTELLKRKGLVK